MNSGGLNASKGQKSRKAMPQIWRFREPGRPRLPLAQSAPFCRQSLPHARFQQQPTFRSFRRPGFLRSRWRAAEKSSVTCCAGSSAASAKRAVWPEWAPSPYADVPPARVEGDKARFSFVGHASWLIQTAGLNILVDPVWSERASPFAFAGPKRHNDPGISLRRPAENRCRAGLAWPLRPSRRRHAVAAHEKILAARDHAARQRSHHAQCGLKNSRRGVRLAGSC